LNKVDVTLGGIPLALVVGDNLTVPAGRTLTLADEVVAGRIGKITLAKDATNPGRLVLTAGAKLVFEATGTGAAVAQAAATFIATGSDTAFVDSADSSTVITNTAATVKSIQAAAGFGVTIKAGTAQDGTIDPTSTFEDAT
jgi:hydroxyethylthiazole kinase-like sugar kinase family protein